MNENKIIDLLHQFGKGKCSPDESALIEDWYIHTSELKKSASPILELMERENRIWVRIVPIRQPHIFSVYQYYVAAIISIIGIIYSLYAASIRDRNSITQNYIPIDIKPDGNKAVFTMANGTIIDLNDTYNGAATTVSGVVISNN
ncbi:hypothetical protein SAMN05518672_11553 [Chitinophaga sp. CF118]|uniref:hypothetical protein n=1 Tax=Chitinophaga sp. CF118 TaxID=1884367 RepID=UPI0008EC759E|nr:hypothetical protein [Chitinophaga sp. CF118]SFF06927.1 hypothetical protein SAMN05518672_11553 [Chitinophaga sp. CF118]